MTEEIELILDITEDQMNESISRLESVLSKIRAGKASPQMLSAVKVDYYGAITPLAQMANINTPDSQTISIQPFDKSVMVDIEKAILEAHIELGQIFTSSVKEILKKRKVDIIASHGQTISHEDGISTYQIGNAENMHQVFQIPVNSKSGNIFNINTESE